MDGNIWKHLVPRLEDSCNGSISEAMKGVGND